MADNSELIESLANQIVSIDYIGGPEREKVLAKLKRLSQLDIEALVEQLNDYTGRVRKERRKLIGIALCKSGGE